MINICWCLKIGLELDIQLLIMTKSEPICIEDMGGAGNRINNFKRTMGVVEIGLVEVLQLTKLGNLDIGNTGLNPNLGIDRIDS